jgi:hypothetical protein
MALSLEDLDLQRITRSLRATFDGGELEGFADGRTAIRDAIVDRLRCSALEAEDLVETLIGRGFVRFEGDPAHAGEDGRWIFARGD